MIKIPTCVALTCFLLGCSPEQGSSNTSAGKKAAEEKVAQEQAQLQVIKDKSEKDRLELASKQHLNQAFAYISSAQSSATKDQKEKALLNAEIEFTNALNLTPKSSEALMNRGVLYSALGKMNKAEEDLKSAAALMPSDSAVFYNLTCLYSVTNKLDLAADALDTALKNGFNNAERLRKDPDLANLRKTKEFKSILEKHKMFIS